MVLQLSNNNRINYIDIFRSHSLHDSKSFAKMLASPISALHQHFIYYAATTLVSSYFLGESDLPALSRLGTGSSHVLPLSLNNIWGTSIRWWEVCRTQLVRDLDFNAFTRFSRKCLDTKHYFLIDELNVDIHVETRERSCRARESVFDENMYPCIGTLGGAIQLLLFLSYKVKRIHRAKFTWVRFIEPRNEKDFFVLAGYFKFEMVGYASHVLFASIFRFNIALHHARDVIQLSNLARHFR